VLPVCLSFFKRFRDSLCKNLVDAAVFTHRQHDDHCLLMSANRRRDEDSRRVRWRGRRRRVLAEDDDAERHRGNGADDLGGNSAGKRDPGRAYLVALPRLFLWSKHIHGNTFAQR
jgi:hypothetical protein